MPLDDHFAREVDLLAQMVHGDVSPDVSTKADGRAVVPDVANAWKDVVVEPDHLDAEDRVVELVNLLDSTHMHAHVIEDVHLLAIGGCGGLADGLAELAIWQRKVVGETLRKIML